MLHELEDKARKIEALIIELRLINDNIKKIEELADIITRQPCEVTFEFAVHTEKDNKAGFDEDGSLSDVPMGGLYNFLMRDLDMHNPTPKKKKTSLGMEMDPVWSLHILQVILDKAKSRRDSILVQLNHM